MIGLPAYNPERKIIGPHLRNGGSALNIGAATGDFLTFLRGHGITGVGIDRNPERVTAARKMGEDVRLGHFTPETATQFDAHSFNLISFRESFYYIEDLAKALDTVRQLLAPNGVLYIKSHVPNSPYYWGGISAKQRVGPDCTEFLTKRQLIKPCLSG